MTSIKHIIIDINNSVSSYFVLHEHEDIIIYFPLFTPKINSIYIIRLLLK
jgi:hypothetical protein